MINHQTPLLFGIRPGTTGSSVQRTRDHRVQCPSKARHKVRGTTGKQGSTTGSQAIRLANPLLPVPANTHQKQFASRWQGPPSTFTVQPHGCINAPTQSHNLVCRNPDCLCLPPDVTAVHYTDDMLLGPTEQAAATTLNLLVSKGEKPDKKSGVFYLSEIFRGRMVRGVLHLSNVRISYAAGPLHDQKRGTTHNGLLWILEATHSSSGCATPAHLPRHEERCEFS